MKRALGCILFLALGLILTSYVLAAQGPQAAPAAGVDVLSPPAQEPALAQTEDWSTNGPYGGTLFNVELDPVSDAVAYVSAASEPYTVGAVLARTGGGSFIGVPEANTVQMLADQINAQGGIDGHPVTVLISDTQSNSATAVQLVFALISDHNALAIIGPSLSGAAMSALGVAQDQEVPLVALASHPGIVEPVENRHWIFKTSINTELTVHALLDYLPCHGLDQVAFMYEDTAFGYDGRDHWAAQAPAAGVTTVVTESFSRGAGDFTSQLTSIAASGAEAVVCWSATVSDAADITEQAGAALPGIPVVHGPMTCQQEFISLAGEDADGALAVCGKMVVANVLPDTDPQKAVLLQYMADYTDTYGTEANSVGGHAWDATQLIFNALDTVGANRSAIRDTIENTTGFPGITGVFDFSASDHNGLSEDDMIIAEVVDGSWQLAAACQRTYVPLVLKNYGP